MTVKRTERGWGGHFICAHRCLFRRNTLLEYGENRIVVSTVGNLLRENSDGSRKIDTVGLDRYFETMAFWADNSDTRYYDADVQRQVRFDSPWAIEEIDADDKANEMHEAIVSELTAKLENGYFVGARGRRATCGILEDQDLGIGSRFEFSNGSVFEVVGEISKTIRGANCGRTLTVEQVE